VARMAKTPGQRRAARTSELPRSAPFLKPTATCPEATEVVEFVIDSEPERCPRCGL
jgi:hypothetical protein